jgi:hypothetical protein
MPVPPAPATLWVTAAPFRYHVHHLMAATGMSWQVIALIAGLPQQQVRTLLFGRDGRLRPRLSPYAARRLLALDADRLRRLQVRDALIPLATDRARALMADGMALCELAERLGLDVHATRRLVEGGGLCSRATDIVLRLTCIERGLLPEGEAREAA